MVKRNESYPAQKNENMRGGEGFVTIETLLTPEELYNKGRLYAKITIPPGASIGYHIHEGEMESYHIICGKAELNDNGETVILSPGDTALTTAGNSHSIKSIGDTDLVFMALILFE